MVVIRNQFHPGPVLHRFAQAEAKVGGGTPLADLAPQQLAARIRAALQRSAMTITDFTLGAGLSKSTIHTIEAGGMPRPLTRQRLERALAAIEAAG